MVSPPVRRTYPAQAARKTPPGLDAAVLAGRDDPAAAGAVELDRLDLLAARHLHRHLEDAGREGVVLVVTAPAAGVVGTVAAVDVEAHGPARRAALLLTAPADREHVAPPVRVGGEIGELDARLAGAEVAARGAVAGYDAVVDAGVG